MAEEVPVDRHEAQVLADLEQQLFPAAVRRLRRRFCAAVTAAVAATAAGLALLGPRFLPLLLVALLVGGLAVVARITPVDDPAPAGHRPAHGHLRRARHASGCSTKS